MKLYGYRYDSNNKRFIEKEISVKESNTHNFRLLANAEKVKYMDFIGVVNKL